MVCILQRVICHWFHTNDREAAENTIDGRTTSCRAKWLIMESVEDQNKVGDIYLVSGDLESQGYTDWKFFKDPCDLGYYRVRGMYIAGNMDTHHYFVYIGCAMYLVVLGMHLAELVHLPPLPSIVLILHSHTEPAI